MKPLTMIAIAAGAGLFLYQRKKKSSSTSASSPSSARSTLATAAPLSSRVKTAEFVRRVRTAEFVQQAKSAAEVQPLRTRSTSVPMLVDADPPEPVPRAQASEPAGGWEAWLTPQTVGPAMQTCLGIGGNPVQNTECVLDLLMPAVKWPPEVSSAPWQHAAWDYVYNLAMGKPFPGTLRVAFKSEA